ncbi:MAG: hypothetical protein ACFFED_16615 [Candidatus Thorarchaeota archaeon]
MPFEKQKPSVLTIMFTFPGPTRGLGWFIGGHEMSKLSVSPLSFG